MRPEWEEVDVPGGRDGTALAAPQGRISGRVMPEPLVFSSGIHSRGHLNTGTVTEGVEAMTRAPGCPPTHTHTHATAQAALGARLTLPFSPLRRELMKA